MFKTPAVGQWRTACSSRLKPSFRMLSTAGVLTPHSTRALRRFAAGRARIRGRMRPKSQYMIRQPVGRSSTRGSSQRWKTLLQIGIVVRRGRNACVIHESGVQVPCRLHAIDGELAKCALHAC